MEIRSVEAVSEPARDTISTVTKAGGGRWADSVVFLGYAYTVVLVLIAIAFRFAARHFWQVELALYLPRVVFALPLPVLVIALLALRRRRALWSQVVAAGVVAFPLMGLVPPGFGRAPRDPAKTLRIFSYNPNFAAGGQEALANEVLAFAPDIAIFQQLFFTDKLSQALAGSYPERRTNGEFFIASRFPIRSAQFPEPLAYQGGTRSGRFIRYELDTRIGPVVVYSVHPISPRYQIDMARRGGLLRSGALFSLKPRPDVEADSVLRTLQVRAFAKMARRETLPVIIAGDTNLPHLSPALEPLRPFRDGFAEAGSGFGYTFPTRRPWMRIDRIFTSASLRVLRFDVGQSTLSDHLPVLAEVELDQGTSPNPASR